MRFLKFDIYEGGHIGFFNGLMSVELGVALSVLSDRRLLLNVPPHAIFNSEKRLNLLDLVELFFPHHAGCFAALEGELLPDLHSCRIGAADLLQFDQATVLSTRNSHTLGYYSYVLPFDERVIYACNNLIAVKEPYRRAASSIVNELRRQHGRFASVHVRRADFVNVHNQTATVRPEEMRYNISCHVPPDCFLLIHSDEMDPAYFGPILDFFPRHCLIDVALFRDFHPHTLDAAEIGVVSALVASHSDIFLGTMFSTFTGYIQRKRLLNGKNGGFLYLYNQRPDSLAFRDGEILESGISGPTWERIEMSNDLKSICFWWREWPESVPSTCLHPRRQPL
jgi:hypothetical protein